jgi:hypothetical protein
VTPNTGHAARSLRSRPYAGDGLDRKYIEQVGGFGKAPDGASGSPYTLSGNRTMIIGWKGNENGT